MLRLLNLIDITQLLKKIKGFFWKLYEYLIDLELELL